MEKTLDRVVHSGRARGIYLKLKQKDLKYSQKDFEVNLLGLDELLLFSGHVVIWSLEGNI